MWTVYETLSAPLPDTFETQHGTSKKPCALERLLMKNRFVETSNVLRFRKSITAVEERGASETCLIVVDGLPGLGKTTTLQNWVAQNDSVYLRAKSSWTPNWMLAELLEVLQVPVPGSAQKKYKKKRWPNSPIGSCRPILKNARSALSLMKLTTFQPSEKS